MISNNNCVVKYLLLIYNILNWNVCGCDKMFRYDDITIILTVYKQKNISEAAKLLYTTQSNLSKRIYYFEQKLGYKIFERSRGMNTLITTNQGEKLIQILREIRKLHNDALDISNLKIKKKIRIATSDGPYNFFLDDLILSLYKKDPDWNFKLKALSYRECMNVVYENIADIAFVGNNIYTKDLNIIPLYCEKMVFICNKTQIYENPINPYQLDIEKSIYSPYSSEFSSWFRKTFNNEQPLIRCDLITQVIKFIKHLNLWSIVPISVAQYINEFININIYEINDHVPDRIIYYAFRSAEKKELIIELVDACRNKIKNIKGINVY